MRKINNIITFLKKYWYYSLLAIPFISVCMNNKTPDNDIWFILNNGRYVLNYGIPHIDTFTIHKGLHYVMQQWLYAVIVYSILHCFGKYGILVFMLCLTTILMTILYKLCYYISKDKFKTVLVVTIALTIISSFITTRPQVLTYIFLLLETYLLEKYTHTKNIKYLYPLPIISLLLMNFHCSMWFMQYVFLLPFLVSRIINKEKIKPILVISIIMFITGFINPYGVEAITFIFKSYGISAVNTLVLEMFPSDYGDSFWKYSIFILLLFLFINVYFSKKKIDYRYLFFIMGTFLLGAMHRKCVVYFILWAAYCFSAIDIEKIKIKKDIKFLQDKVFLEIKRSLSLGLSICLIITLFLTIKLTFEIYNFKDLKEGIVKYTLKNYDVSTIKMYTTYDDGGYTEYYNIKSYIDPRAELFVKKSNKKADILTEATKMYDEPSDKTIKKLLEKYNFTHILERYDSIFERYLRNDSNYIKEYTEYTDSNKKNPIFTLYVRKDISVLNKKKELKKEYEKQ